MKIIFLFLSFWVLNVENIQAEEPVNTEKGIPTKIELDVERYQKNALNKLILMIIGIIYMRWRTILSNMPIRNIISVSRR